MDTYTLSLLVIGLLLLLITLGSSWIARLPLSYALIYLVVGIFLGPYGIKLVEIRPGADFLQRLSEIVVLISLFSCGLRINRPLEFWAWQSTARLIGFLMPISIVGIAAVGHWLLNLSWGAAILLGAILAPTDPVLASEVQLTDLEDRDELRFGLTSEGGLNDAFAFPFVYFGLFYLENDNWQSWFRDWVAVDLIWATGVAIAMGIIVARATVWIDSKSQKIRALDEVREDFIAISTILLTYSLTEFVNGYGFLAVFIAGLVVQRSYKNTEKSASQSRFIDRIEKLSEVGTILLLGSLLRNEPIIRFAGDVTIIAGLLFFVIRPVGAWLSTIGDRSSLPTRLLFGWFGIRGVGSIYYLTYAMSKGLKGDVAEQIAWITYLTVAISVILHGITATPLMNWYEHTNRTKLTPKTDTE